MITCSAKMIQEIIGKEREMVIMKAKVLRGYPDKITNRWYNKDEIVDFEEKRIKELVEKGIVSLIQDKKGKQNNSEE